MDNQKINSMVAGSLLAAGLMCATNGASAYQAGDMILRAGVVSVQPDESSSALKLNGTVLSGTGAGVDNDTMPGVTGTYMFTPHVGVGILAATFEHDITANGLGVDAGSAKILPPTFTAQYFPMDSASAFQPYVGIGFNYTMFFSEDVDSELEGVLGNGSVELDDSFGLAGQIGFDYAIDEHWLLNASIWYIDISTDAEFNFDSGDRVTADVDIDPWVYMLGVGYKF